jgi:iron complex transport system permease protein
LLFGGFFLTVCDTFARSVIPPAEIPAGVITALLGGPFFIALLLNKKGDMEL